MRRRAERDRVAAAVLVAWLAQRPGQTAAMPGIMAALGLDEKAAARAIEVATSEGMVEDGGMGYRLTVGALDVLSEGAG